MPSYTALLKAIQLKARFLFGLWLVGMLLLFISDGLAKIIGFQEIRDNYRGWIGLGTIVSFAFWLIQLVPYCQQARAVKRYKREVIQSLSSLSDDEVFLLAFCVDRAQRTLTLKVTHRAANAPESKRTSGYG